MKLNVDREKLHTAVLKLSTVVPGKPTLPILKSILFKAEDGKLALYATNLEAFLYTTIPTRVVEPGEAVIDSTVLKSIVSKKLPTDSISICVKDKTATITSGAFSVDTPVDKTEDYPSVPTEVNDTPLKIGNFREALRSVSYAMMTETYRPVLNSVYINKQGKVVEASAADGFRLVIAKLKTTGDLKANVLIPYETVTVLLKTLTDSSVLLHTETGEGKPANYQIRATLKYDGYTLTTICTPGTFPNYRQLIPNHKQYTKFQVEDMVKALSYFPIDKNTKARLVGDKSKLHITTGDYNQKYKYHIPYKCHRIKIALNGIYLKELLSHLEGEALFKFNGATNPLYVKQGITQHILMPMFVTWDKEGV